MYTIFFREDQNKYKFTFEAGWWNYCAEYCTFAVIVPNYNYKYNNIIVYIIYNNYLFYNIMCLGYFLITIRKVNCELICLIFKF